MIGQTPKLEVQLRGGFADRNKIKVENCTLQTDSFDTRTRTALINATRIILSSLRSQSGNVYQEFLKTLLSEVYIQEVDWQACYDHCRVEEIIFDTLRTDNYDSVLTLLEFIAKSMSEFTIKLYSNALFSKAIPIYNAVFEQEYVGYRFVDDIISPITGEVERAAIENALNSKLQEVQQHFRKAATFLADRISPDYANSIKESISAVERMCSIILGGASTLGAALKKLEAQGVVIHPSLKDAFNKLYGFTSDSSGIRHAGQLDGSDATFEEAEFMLVTCSAFVNYLTSLYSKNPQQLSLL